MPIEIVAVLFGFTMNHEIFLISRIRTLYLAGADDAASIREGLGDTGAVINQAALIMTVVFGFFVEVVACADDRLGTCGGNHH